MQRTSRWLLGICAAAIILLLPAWVAWNFWRAHTLLAFCKEVHVGMPFTEFLSLERRHWINESYLVQAHLHGYIDQAHSTGLEFRSQMLDPDFACAVNHDGRSVTSLQLLTLEGFDPK